MCKTPWLRSLWTILLVGTLLPFACFAEIREAGEVAYWADPSVIAVDGNRIFAHSWPKGLGVFDVTDPAVPQETLLLPSGVSATESGLAVSGNLLYTGVISSRFQIYDITVLNHPLLLSEVDVFGGVTDILLQGTLAVVGDLGGSARLIDVTSPMAPVTRSIVGAGRLLGFVDGYLCTLHEGQGLLIWNINNPDDPAIVAALPPSPEETYEMALLDGHTLYCKLVVDDGSNDGIRIIDLTNPLQPQLRGANEEYPIWFRSMTVIDSTLYATTLPGWGIKVWDVRDLDHPTLITNYDPENHYGCLFSCNGQLGASVDLRPYVLGLFDVTNPAAPQRVSRFAVQANITQMRIHEDHLFASDDIGGLHAIDLQDPTAPVEHGPVDGIECGYDVVLEDHYAYVASGIEGVHIVDVSDPQHPLAIARVGDIGFAREVEADGDYVYALSWLQTSGFRLYTIDVTQPALPAVTDWLDLDMGMGTMALYASNLYVADTTAGSIISLIDPAHPAIAAQNLLALRGRSVTIFDSLAYVTRGFQGWSVVSLANPLEPAVVYTSSPSAGRSATNFCARGSWLFVTYQIADIWRFQVQLYDVSDPAHPALRDQTPLTEIPIGPMACLDSTFYVSCGFGYAIFTCPEIDPPPAHVTPPAGAPPARVALAGPYPNPFNPRATLRFTLPHTAPALLAVYDVLGREVAVLVDDVLGAGEHVVVFDGSDLAAGVYFARLEAEGNVRIEKLMLLK